MLSDSDVQDLLFQEHIYIGEQHDSARDDWYVAECKEGECWHTMGGERVVRDAAYDHVYEEHVPDLRMGERMAYARVIAWLEEEAAVYNTAGSHAELGRQMLARAETLKAAVAQLKDWKAQIEEWQG